MWIEQAGEHLRAERPVRTDELDQRALRHLRDVVARARSRRSRRASRRPRAADRELRRREAAARRREDDSRAAGRVDHRLELAGLGLDRRPRVELARGEPAAEAVEAQDAVRLRDLLVEGALAQVRPLLLEMPDPARAEDDRRAFAVGRVGEARPRSRGSGSPGPCRRRVLARTGHLERWPVGPMRRAMARRHPWPCTRKWSGGSRFGRSGRARREVVQAVFDRLGPRSRLLRFGGAKNVLLRGRARAAGARRRRPPRARRARPAPADRDRTARARRAEAEVAFAVADDWQRRGVGTVLAERLAADARAAGIERCTRRCAPTTAPRWR